MQLIPRTQEVGQRIMFKVELSMHHDGERLLNDTAWEWEVKQMRQKIKDKIIQQI